MYQLVPAEQDLFDVCNAVWGNGTVTGTAETGVLGNATVQLQYSTGILAHGVVYFTPGAGCTGLTIRIRAGYGTAGAIVWEAGNLAVVAGQLNAIPINGIFKPDTYLAAGGAANTVTFQQTGSAPADGLVQQGYISWFNTRRTVADPADLKVGTFVENSAQIPRIYG